eukprot:TRINITY_DN54797_c0_g1_i1.p1 TRINITY_DN54797_c0_g1~~TRINITY_DN54797_c0_g1_i1.p1  ORF type:complete len:600 (-),score=105.27 TRINITY_DN54797_c0_g1_i1:81-1880(-)
MEDGGYKPLPKADLPSKVKFEDSDDASQELEDVPRPRSRAHHRRSLQEGRKPTDLPWQRRAERRSTWGGAVSEDLAKVREALISTELVTGSSLSKGHRPELAFLAKKSSGPLSWRDQGKLMLSSTIFQILMAALILGNAIVIGIETDDPGIANFPVIEFWFLIVFVVEITVRLFIFGKEYFDRSSGEFYWNLFDFTVVFLGVLDGVFEFFSSVVSLSSMSTLFRMIRLLRILRLFRIVRFLKTLYVLSVGLIEASIAVFWVAMLFGMILTVCSIIVVRVVHLEPSPTYVSQHSDDFGGILTSMLALFEVMAHHDIDQSLTQHWLGRHIVVDCLVIVFTIFGSFGMTALLTGLVSQGMFDKNQLRLEEERQEREAKLEVLSDHCSALFDEARATSDGKAPKQELIFLLPFVEEMFRYNDVSYAQTDLNNIISFMDADDKGGVKKDEFCQCILSIADRGRPMSSLELQYSMTLVKMKLAKSLPMIQGGSESSSKLVSCMLDARREEQDLSAEIEDVAELQNQTDASTAASLDTMTDLLSNLSEMDASIQEAVKAQAKVDAQCRQSIQDAKSSVDALRKQVRLVDSRLAKAVAIKKAFGTFP